MPVQALLLLTAAEIAGRTLFRAARVTLELRPGTGRIWLDVSHGRRYTEVWQQHLRLLQATGQRAYPHLAWESTDLFLTALAKDLLLDGRSASLPLFLAWLSLLTETPLPDPFLATGVALDSEMLLPAPSAFIQGKLEVAEALTVQRYPGGPFPTPFWFPAGSEVESARAPHLALHPVASLTDAADQLLGPALDPASTRSRHTLREDPSP